MADQRNGDKGGRVVHLRFPEKSNASGDPARTFRKSKAEFHVLPARVMSAEEAIKELNRFIPGEGKQVTSALLRFPDNVMFCSFPGGIEFYDSSSDRPCYPTADESLHDIVGWVKHWYFSVFKKGDMLLGRFVDHAYPGRKCAPLEYPIHVPGSERFSLEKFIRLINEGGP
jgi:hypothetical protein